MNIDKIKSYGKSVIETEISGARRLLKTINSDFVKAINRLAKVKGKVEFKKTKSDRTFVSVKPN